MGKKAIKFFDNFFIFHKNGIKILLNVPLRNVQHPHQKKKKTKNKQTNKTSVQHPLTRLEK